MDKLYIHTTDVHNLSAAREVVPILINLTKPKSVLDVGCGTGTWLKIFEEQGIQDCLGIDGEYVDREMLVIDKNKFLSKDLRTIWSVNRKFDLVVSLEVAEHLPEEKADLFVEVLVAHATAIVFSAAIPLQGGQHHLNEQWPDYWQKKFEKHGYYFHDTIRPLIWNNTAVDWWYRQNIFLVTREPSDIKILPVIHPELFYKHQNTLKKTLAGDYAIGYYFKFIWKAIKRKLKI